MNMEYWVARNLVWDGRHEEARITVRADGKPVVCRVSFEAIEDHQVESPGSASFAVGLHTVRAIKGTKHGKINYWIMSGGDCCHAPLDKCVNCAAGY